VDVGVGKSSDGECGFFWGRSQFARSVLERLGRHEVGRVGGSGLNSMFVAQWKYVISTRRSFNTTDAPAWRRTMPRLNFLACRGVAVPLSYLDRESVQCPVQYLFFLSIVPAGTATMSMSTHLDMLTRVRCFSTGKSSPLHRNRAPRIVCLT
jgi:hypothetical protein